MLEVRQTKQYARWFNRLRDRALFSNPSLTFKIEVARHDPILET